MGSFFFSPKGRMKVSHPLALTMNTLNVLAPSLLLVAVTLAIISKFGGNSFELNQLFTIYAAILVVMAIIIRIIWGATIRTIQKRMQSSKGKI